MPEIDNGRNFVQILFYLVFLSQILLISFYYPRKILNRMRHVFDTYPPSAYPKLYPKPVEYYELRRRNYRTMNSGILLVGLLILAGLVGYPGSTAWGGRSDFFSYSSIAFLYFLVQCFPIMLLDLSSIKCFRLMRSANSTRKAELQPRRLFDFVSPAIIGIAVSTYIAFCVFIIYIRKFEFEWFGGYANIFGATLMNLFFSLAMFWQIYGKKLDPHQAPDDRKRQITILVHICVFVSISATIFVAISVVLSALDMRNLQAVSQSLYFQLIGAISLQAYRMDSITNFDVYKEDPLVRTVRMAP